MTNLIVTITDHSNYGNRLQNYALQTLLSQYDKTTTAFMDIGITSRAKKTVKSCKRLIRPLYAKIMNNDLALESKRIQNCKRFSEKYVSEGLFALTDYQGLTTKGNQSFDRVVIGSDQVWNPEWLTDRELELRLGSFAPTDCPVISYAASFGASSVRDTSIPIFQKYLPRLKAISVREFRGAELVKEMTNLDATVVLDPTLMINADRWSDITENFVPKNDKYVLTYFLGCPTDEQEQDIQAYARKHGCRVRRLYDLRDKETYCAGPQDFVELFSKAQYVFTDSYHACCFSILFHKQFTVFNRSGLNKHESMNSRMETLFKLFDLDSVVMDSGLAPEIDYTNVDHLLEKHRQDSQQWLDKAMQK